MQPRRSFVASLLAGAAALISTRVSRADGIQTVGNEGQIVSTGDVVIRQAAGGTQNIYTADGRLIGTAASINDLQIVSTGNVVADQSAASQQTLLSITHFDGNPKQGKKKDVCTPGEYYQAGSCAYFCAPDRTWMQHCCTAC